MKFISPTQPSTYLDSVGFSALNLLFERDIITVRQQKDGSKIERDIISRYLLNMLNEDGVPTLVTGSE